ncbi:MAG: hypothetical protein Q7S40_06760 [Opitutaceae bacterium]|nr:hypothetical protein [Opitutaceae bacterium]
MNLSAWAVVAVIGSGFSASRAADATTPIDYTLRNGAFAPQSSVTPSKSSPAANRSVQDARVEKPAWDKPSATIGDRRAAIAVKENGSKQVREKQSHRPVAEEQRLNEMNKRRARISTADERRKPPMVAKYQDSLTAASATNMARFPAMDANARLTINRFVFRKNGADSPAIAADANVTPAAGGGLPMRK